MSAVKQKPKQSQQPIRRMENITQSQWELNVYTSKLNETRINANDQVAIGVSFECDWFKKKREFS